MSLRNRPRIMIESLEARVLMAGDVGSFLVATPVLSSNTFLFSQFSGVAAVQLAENEGPALALSLQAGSSLDLTGSSPTAFLNEQFFMQKTPTPALLPTSR